MMKILTLFLIIFFALPSYADNTHFAVAGAFNNTMLELVSDFEKRYPHKITFEIESTGNLFAKIQANANFDAFLSADKEHSDLLVKSGVALDSNRFSFAMGKLVLWSKKADLIDARGEVLKNGSFKTLAIPDANKVPYGVAALEVLKSLGVLDKLQSKFVMMPNNLEVRRAVEEGRVDLGFLALSVLDPKRRNEGSLWIVPRRVYRGVEHQAILLKQGEKNQAALDFMLYLKSPFAQEILESYGYNLPSNHRAL